MDDIRRIDDLGRIVIPKEIRKKLGIKEGAPMEINITDTGVLLTEYKPETKLRNLLEQAQTEIFILDGDFDKEKETEINKLLVQAVELLRG